MVSTTELTQVIVNAASWMFLSRKDDTGEDQGSGGGIPTAGAECVAISRAERSWVFPLKPDGEEWRVHVFPAQNSQQCPHPGVFPPPTLVTGGQARAADPEPPRAQAMPQGQCVGSKAWVFEICPYGSESFLILTAHIIHVHQNYFSRLYFGQKRSSLPFLVIKVLTTTENLENVEIK